MAEQNLKEKGETKNPRRKQSSTKPETEEDQTIYGEELHKKKTEEGKKMKNLNKNRGRKMRKKSCCHCQI
jgi:hypothetical protein